MIYGSISFSSRSPGNIHANRYAAPSPAYRPHTTLKNYAKRIPGSLRTVVAALDAQITGAPVTSK